MSEARAHVVALLIAIFGPLINIIIKLVYPYIPTNFYIYWGICLAIYIFILLPFTRKSKLILLKLIPLGIMAEDFFSNMWKSLFEGSRFLPFCNWYTQQFPFLGSLGEPTPFILIPRWYFLAFFAYALISYFQKNEKKVEKGLMRLLSIPDSPE